MKNLHLTLIQTIAVTGLVVSGAAEIGMYFTHKTVPNFWMLYPIWAGVFIVGTLIRVYGSPDDHHHHHHHHAEDHSH